MTATGYQIMKRKTTEALKAELGKVDDVVVVSLPWPSTLLSPNARICWATKASVTKRYKKACWGLLMEKRRLLKGRTKFKITFRRPDRHAMDMDNAIASFKAGQDAMSIVTGVNDRLFQCTSVFGEPVKGGAVEITVLDAAKAA